MRPPQSPSRDTEVARMPGLLDITRGSPRVMTMTSPASRAIGWPPSLLRWVA
jgi:hypothetical protein